MCQSLDLFKVYRKLSLQEQAAQMVMNGEMDMEEAEKVIYSAD